MAASRDDIFQKALSLQTGDRADLVGLLIRSLDSEVEEDAEEAWRMEIERRARGLDSGAVQCISWEVVRERLVRVVLRTQ